MSRAAAPIPPALLKGANGANGPMGPVARLSALAHRYRQMILPAGFVVLLGVILVPLPPVALDVLITVNIALSILILLTTLSITRPLDFSSFPSLLLVTTMFRLVLNVASTRLILTADAATPEEAIAAAGQVVSTFGTFVAGGSLVVGVIIFLILMVVQFMVVTKGAGRVGEVAARFTLDAMPGKQLAIDADLAAGIINEAQARERREQITREADFYGAMDGASKFVKGDSIAGIIITAINIFGGFAIGMLQRGWPAAQTAETFTILTIGDGLTSQLPSLVISIASALIVTQSSQKGELGGEIGGQVFASPRALSLTAGFLALLAMTPLPTIPLLTIAAALGGLAYALNRGRRASAAAQASTAAQAKPPAQEPPPVDDLLKVDVLELEVGYGVVRLVDRNAGGDLLDRITAVRRQLAAEIGLVMPPVRIRDNLQLEHNQYRIKIRGNPVAQARVEPDKLLAMDSGIASGKIEGVETTEPAFGLRAWWITKDHKSRAERLNYTVVDPSSVTATHITEVVRRHAAELLTREEVANLVEGLKARAPKLVEEIIPGVVKLADLQRVLHNLLRERVPIRDVETVLEALGDWAPKSKDIDVLTEYARNALRRTICQQHASPGDNGKPRIVCVTLDPAFEDEVASYVDRGPAGTAVNMPARVATALTQQISTAVQRLTAGGHPQVVVASPQVRGVVRQMIEGALPHCAVLGYNEVAGDLEVQSIALVSPPAKAAPKAAA